MIRDKNIEWSTMSDGVTGDTSGHLMLKALLDKLFPENVFTSKPESVVPEEACGRVLAEDILAKFDTPLFSESTRDGYAIGRSPDGLQGKQASFTLVGASGAGDDIDAHLKEGEAWRVMTGGKVPGSCSRVLPLEWCRKEDQRVIVAAERLAGPAFVRSKGGEHKAGELLVQQGEVISPQHLLQIVSGGYGKVQVFAQPRVCFCSTGKELIDAGTVPVGSEKVSSNQYLLSAFLKRFGCYHENYGIIGDEAESVARFFSDTLRDNFDLVLTTGGTGGGDYDLVEKSFLDAGGTLVCNTLGIRPGKSVVAGYKGTTFYLGLPGPPTAVHTLFLELVAPILQRMSGLKDFCNPLLLAVAEESISAKTRGDLLIKEGVLRCQDGKISVRRAEKKERTNCNILIPPDKEQISQGALVEVHLRDPGMLLPVYQV